MLDQISRQHGHPIELVPGPAVLDCYVPALDITGFAKAPSELSDTDGIVFRRSWAQKANHRYSRLLRAHRERSGEGCATDQRDELPTPHGTPGFTRMPEYQMSHASTKAIAASRSARGARGPFWVIFHRGVYVSFRCEPVVRSTVYGRFVPGPDSCAATKSFTRSPHRRARAVTVVR